MTTKRRPIRHMKDWSKTDKRVMRALARRKLSARQAAPLLGRTTGAVKFAAMTYGVHFRAINQKPGTQRRPSQRALLRKLRIARARKRAA